MKNNELFIDTMDKINSLAKSRGFTNGIEWAKAAAKVNKISALNLSAYENIHTLRNLMAHGSARDISISAETLSEVLTFLSQIMQSPLRPIPEAPSVDFSGQSYVQPGDIIFLPFFQGFIDFANGGNKPTEKYYDASIRYSGLYIADGSEAGVNEYAGIFGQVNKNSVTFFVTFFVGKDFKFARLPKDLKDLYYIVLRPNDELKAMILNHKENLIVTEFMLSDGRFSFKAAVARAVQEKFEHYDRYSLSVESHNITSYKYDFSNYKCHASCIKVGFTRLDRVPANKNSFKLKSDLFLAFPPKGNQPYVSQIDLRYSHMCHFVDSWSKEECHLPEVVSRFSESVKLYGGPDSVDDLPF